MEGGNKYKMKNKKAEAVIKRLQKENEVFTIQISGNQKNRENGFYILMNSQRFSSTSLNEYHGIKQSTLKLLDEAEIKFKILK